ncbi:PAS domain S-box protein, partial [bacterium]|nr:PAS domain S-box protein [bacterium]
FIEPGGTFIRTITLAMLVLISSILVAGIPSIACGAEDPLSTEERAWLKEHDGKIIVNNEAGWPPIIDTDKDDNSFGIVMDYQRLIEKKLNFKFKMDKLDSWKNFMERFRKGEIDVNNNLQKNLERTEYALFTKPYIEIPNAVIVRKEIEGSLSLEKMRGMKIAVTNGFAIHDYIKNNYDYLQLIPLDDDLSCLLQVSTKDVDAAVVNLAVASFIIEKMGIANLRVAGYTKYKNALCFASRKDWPILNRILEKGLNLITPAERDAIYRKWISLGDTPFYKTRIFWIIAFSVTAMFLLIISMILVWNLNLKRQVELRTEKLETINIQLKNEMDEREHAEEALQKSEEKYRLIAENTADQISVIDMNLHFTYVSPAIMSLRGFTVEEAMEQTLDKVLTPESMRASLTIFEEEMELEASGTADPDRTRILELEEYKKDGSIIWVEASFSFMRDKDRKPVGILIVSRDISERKKAEDVLRKSEEKYQTLVENTNETILVIQDGMVKFVNSKGSESFGYTEQEFLSTPIFELIHPEDRDAVIERYVQKIHGDTTPTRHTYRIIHKNGQTQWIEISSVLIEWEGRPATLNLIINITERVRAEEEKRNLEERLQRAEKMESLGLLAGGVAHDLNNVLGIVIGFAEMLLMGADKSSPIRPKLVNIMEGGQKAAAIVQDLLTLARRGVSGRDVLNLNKILADWQKSPEFEKLTTYHSAVKIKTDLDPDLLNISASSVHLGKTISNLVSNASEAMPKGGVLTIKTANQYLDRPIQGYDKIQEGDYVVLSVSDTGEGIHKTDLKRIFEPFYTKKVMGRSGTGLGLAVVWGTVKDHNGYINVESEEGKGSTFTLYFPVTREELSAGDIAVSISEYMGKGESILVVDDVKGQRDLAEEMLKKLNYSVKSVSSGEEAVTYLKEHKADLLVLDMIMDPGMDGLDTYRSILGIYPKQKAIIVSGFSESDRVKAAQALGAGAYVRKPYVIEKLGLAVKKKLDRAI